MPTIKDYVTLGQSLQDFAHRSDIASYQDYFIQAGIDDIQNDILVENYGNGIKFQEKAFTATPISASGTLAVPADFLSPKDFLINDGGGDLHPLIFKASTWLYNTYPTRLPTGLPAYIARDGAAFVFGPYPDSAYSVQGTYYAQAPMLSVSNPTNWMITSAPVLLQAACLTWVSKFLKDADMLSMWQGVYTQKLQALIEADKAERWAASTMQVEIS